MIITLIAFASMSGGALLGLLVRSRLPKHHLSEESKDVLKVAVGLIGTLVALVLGLLVSSAKSSFDSMNAGVTQSGAKVILLDRVLAHYGPETKDARDLLRRALADGIERIWPTDGTGRPDLKSFETAVGMEDVERKLRELTPQNESQRAIQSQALQITGDVLQTRWLLLAQTQQSLPMLFVIILVLWLAVLYIGFGLLAPGHATTIVSLLVCALSVSGAIFLILEMNNPTGGIITISSGPLVKALSLLGK
jgi:ABC-type multidrug transport system fused ATPase/permease subunit